MQQNNPFNNPPSSFFVSDSLKDSIDMESFSLENKVVPSNPINSTTAPLEDDKLPMTLRVVGKNSYQGVLLGVPVSYILGHKRNKFTFMAHVSEATTILINDKISIAYDSLELDYAKVISIKVDNIKNNIAQITLVLEAN